MDYEDDESVVLKDKTNLMHLMANSNPVKTYTISHKTTANFDKRHSAPISKTSAASIKQLDNSQNDSRAAKK